MLMPRTKAPDLEVPKVGGGSWALREQDPEQFTMVVFYRGLHCPVCKGYLRDLEGRLEEFRSRGVEVVAISGDSRERAEQTQEKWGSGP